MYFNNWNDGNWKSCLISFNEDRFVSFSSPFLLDTSSDRSGVQRCKINENSWTRTSRIIVQQRNDQNIFSLIDIIVFINWSIIRKCLKLRIELIFGKCLKSSNKNFIERISRRKLYVTFEQRKLWNAWWKCRRGSMRIFYTCFDCVLQLIMNSRFSCGPREKFRLS